MERDLITEAVYSGRWDEELGNEINQSMTIDMLACLLGNEGVSAPALVVVVSEKRLGTILPELSLQMNGKKVYRQSDDLLWPAAGIGKGC